MNLSELPDNTGYFGRYGGRFVPEILIPALEELEQAYKDSKTDENFQKELLAILREFSGRPTQLTFAERLTKQLGGGQIFLKREDLNHTGAHKINNAIGQILLARKMGKKRIIAETGAGQHGVATATVAAKFGLECIVYMGTEDIRRQALNVFRMELLGAKVIPVESGSATLKDAINEAIRDWVANVHDTFYLIGSVVGPHPYPMIVRDFQSVIGSESRAQCLERTNRLPDLVVACVGGGSNAIGMFYPFINDNKVRLVGVEAAGAGIHTDKHASTLSLGAPGILHGAFSYLLQDNQGQIQEAYSVSAGLDYPGVGPEHSNLKDSGRATYHTVTDEEAIDALKLLSRTEGIIPALESAHAIAWLVKEVPKLEPNQHILLCLSGRGDKDVETLQAGSGAVVKEIEDE